jgi:BTB/POZ domain
MNLYNRARNENLADLVLISKSNTQYYFHRNILKFRSGYLYEKIMNKNGLYEVGKKEDDILIKKDIFRY